jgi:hypothetical protein
MNLPVLAPSRPGANILAERKYLILSPPYPAPAMWMRMLTGKYKKRGVLARSGLARSSI